MARKTKKNISRRTKSAVNYSLLKKLWESGADYITIAKKLNRYFPERGSDGATKSVRAIVSNCLRGKSKNCALKPRSGKRAVGIGKRAAHRKSKKAHKANGSGKARPAIANKKKFKNTTAKTTAIKPKAAELKKEEGEALRREESGL